MSPPSLSARNLRFTLDRFHWTRSWFAKIVQIGKVLDTLKTIGREGDPSSIASVARLLVGEPRPVRRAAAKTLQELLSRAPPSVIFELGDLRCQMSDYDHDAFYNIHPEQVQSIARDEATRTAVLGVLSNHHNGYVREEAVRLLSQVTDGSELPYLLVRQNDWVAPISVRARQAVAERLHDGYLPHFVRALPLVVRLLGMSRRDHVATVRKVVGMLCQAEHEDELGDVLQWPERLVRRQVVRIGLEFAGEAQRRVLDRGLFSADATIRLWCLRKTPGVLSSDELTRTLERLRRDRFQPVRRETLRIEAEHFPERASAVWETALLDPHPSIRELARFELNQRGSFDAAAVYRAHLADHPGNLAAIAGLGETGDRSDVDRLRPYLSSPLANRRRAALRAVAALGKESVIGELVIGLSDPSPAVVRDTQKALQPLLHLVPEAPLCELAAGDHPWHIRSTACRLIFEKGKWTSLPWLIRLAASPDQPTAELARNLAESWFSPPLSNRIFATLYPEDRPAIDAALAANAAALPDAFRHNVQKWLARS